jgi:hypothetical protein
MKGFAFGAVAAAAVAIVASDAMAAGSGRSAGSGTAAFPASTTIYIVTGLRDDNGAAETGVASSVTCANVSGVPVNIRVAAFTFNGAKKGDETINNVPHAGVRTFSTHFTKIYFENRSLETGTLNQGVFNVEATNANVFCSATVESGVATSPTGFGLHMIRVNPAPGTDE